MKYTIILLSVIFLNYGCKDAYPKEEKTKDIINYDTVINLPRNDIQIEPEPDTNRYFLISYSTSAKEFYSDVQGYYTLISKKFPIKHDIDDYVYDRLAYKRSCYQGIIINLIFEFNNKSDYDSFNEETKEIDKVKVVKNKKSCQ